MSVASPVVALAQTSSSSYTHNTNTTSVCIMTDSKAGTALIPQTAVLCREPAATPEPRPHPVMYTPDPTPTPPPLRIRSLSSIAANDAYETIRFCDAPRAAKAPYPYPGDRVELREEIDKVCGALSPGGVVGRPPHVHVLADRPHQQRLLLLLLLLLLQRQRQRRVARQAPEGKEGRPMLSGSGHSIAPPLDHGPCLISTTPSSCLAAAASNPRIFAQPALAWLALSPVRLWVVHRCVDACGGSVAARERRACADRGLGRPTPLTAPRAPVSGPEASRGSVSANITAPHHPQNDMT
jgi:hypothetical protein